MLEKQKIDSLNIWSGVSQAMALMRQRRRQRVTIKNQKELLEHTNREYNEVVCSIISKDPLKLKEDLLNLSATCLLAVAALDSQK